MSEIRALETQYKGYRFRSRLEARWAVFMDAMGIRWEYEKEGYELGDAGRYLPDFWLPEVSLRAYKSPGIWLEIKGENPTVAEQSKAEALTRATQYPVILAVGMPDAGENMENDGMYEFVPGSWDNCMRFVECGSDKCGHIKVEFSESNYMFCPVCGAHADSCSPHLLAAFSAAKAARFEHGETPTGRA